jgi:glycosyltransferase involved in cell wall biosynthesis
VTNWSTLRCKDSGICILATGYTALCYLLSDQIPDTVAGPDVHLFLLITELKRFNKRIFLVVNAADCKNINEISGIELIKIPRYYNPFLNLIMEQFFLSKIFIKFPIEVIYQRGNIMGVFNPICHIRGIKYFYSNSSDGLIDKSIIRKKVIGFSFKSIIIGQLIMKIGIKMSSLVIVQTEMQKHIIEIDFNKKCKLIKTPYPIDQFPVKIKDDPPIVLWVGSIAFVKQPELFLMLAKSLPSIKFQMIGGPSKDLKYFKKIMDEAIQIPNLKFLGRVPFTHISPYFAKGSLLINTSIFEGFPHAFIEAWSNYNPVVSLYVDPDEIICKYKLGLHSKSFDELIKNVNYLITNKENRIEMGLNGRNYVEKEHNISNIMKEYIEIFNFR